MSSQPGSASEGQASQPAGERVFEAFVAGFMASSEGMNGEWVSDRHAGRENFRALMRELFEDEDCWERARRLVESHAGVAVGPEQADVAVVPDAIGQDGNIELATKVVSEAEVWRGSSEEGKRHE